jgi:hypothetical protein
VPVCIGQECWRLRAQEPNLFGRAFSSRTASYSQAQIMGSACRTGQTRSKPSEFASDHGHDGAGCSGASRSHAVRQCTLAATVTAHWQACPGPGWAADNDGVAGPPATPGS